MNPGLVSRRRLRIRVWAPDRGRAPVAIGALVVAIGAAGLVSAATRTPVPPQPALRTVSSVTYIAGTQIPAPPTTFGLVPGVVHGGHHVFRPGRSPFTAAGARALFDYYLSTMARGGWTLAGKADPSRLGEWTLKWDFQQRSALLTLYMTPTPRLTVDACPPVPYC